MELLSLELQGFRGLADQTIDLEPEPFRSGGLQPIVFVGTNGSGKSSLLEAIAILLSWVTTRLVKPNGKGRSLQPSDIRTPDTSQALIRLTLDPNLYPSRPITWELACTQNGQNPTATGHYDQLNDWLKEHRSRYGQEPDLTLPCIVYYPTHRRLQAPQLFQKLKRQGFQSLDIYKEALPDATAEFDEFLQWLNYQTALEDNQRLNTSLDYRDPHLCVVRTACSQFLKDYGELRILRTATDTTIVVQKHSVTLNITQLSDGEKNLLTLVGDLARRLAIANPHLSDPLQGTGVVLIDEIELHLHPQWQSSILEKLCTTFPNCQFILTTHSPQVITNLDWVYLLEPTPQGNRCRSVRTYGKDSNRILEAIMEAPSRSALLQQKVQHLFALIKSGKLEQAHALRSELLSDLDDPSIDPELIRASWLMTDYSTEKV
jgi:predicted ATP-binding protein involved in virulence